MHIKSWSLSLLIAIPCYSFDIEKIDNKRDSLQVLQLIKEHAPYFDTRFSGAQDGYERTTTIEMPQLKTVVMNTRLYVYRDNNQVVGFISYRYVNKSALSAMIARLAVREDYRRKGIATALLKKTLQDLQEQNQRSVMTKILTGTPHAAELYSKLGFGKTHEDATGIIMHRTLIEGDQNKKV